MLKFLEIIETVRGKTGIEFGGPTELFSNPNYNMNIYPHVELDGANIFEDNHFQKITENFYYGGKIGKQYNIDCVNEDQLSKLEKKYDFILTSHVIEHIANPIKSLHLWKKYVLRDGGFIVSVIPDYQYCFDRKRPLTSLDHLIEDYFSGVDEDDNTHIEEQKKLHDWTCGGHKDFYKLCDKNGATRVVHHHTFNINLVEEMFEYCGFEKILSFKHDDLNIVNLSKRV